MIRTEFGARERALLEKVRRAIWATEPGAQVILYGSRARGEATADSDWDLLVLVDGSSDPDREKALQQQIYALELETGECISAILHGREEWASPRSRIDPFHANVEDDGIDLATMQPLPGDEEQRWTEREMAEAREELVREWMARARSGIEEAGVLAQASLWNASVSRLYYACFDAVRALLLADGHRFSKHRNVQSLFNRHYGRTARVPRDLIDLYNTLFPSRGRADYEAFVRFDEATVRPWIAGSERLIDVISGLINGLLDSGAAGDAAP